MAESKVLGEKGGPPPEPLPTLVDRTAPGLGKRKAIAAERLGSSRFSPFEAGRLRPWNKEKENECGSDDEDQIHTSNNFAALADESSSLGQLMNQDG